MTEKTERREIFIRIVVAIISGIILGIWRWLIVILAVVNWFYTLFFGKRNKEMAELSEIWNTQLYSYTRYLTFVTNKRPFPFDKLKKSISSFKE